jgi:hypothetical protein
MDGVHQLKRGDDGAGGEDVDLESPARHLLDLFAPGDEDVVEDVLRRPGRLHLERDRLLRRRPMNGGKAEHRGAARGHRRLKNAAPGNLRVSLFWDFRLSGHKPSLFWLEGYECEKGL